MKPMLTLMLVILTAWVAFGQNTNFATRIYADFDSPEDGVRDLTMLQGTAPILEINPVRGTRRINADTGTTVKIVFGPSATNTYFVQTNAYLATNQSYFIQLPTLGTNTCAAGSDVPSPWWYSLLFYSNDGLYWAGEGRMYIEATDATGEALSWQTIAGGVSEEVDPVLAALLATADPNSTNALLADGTLFDISALLAAGSGFPLTEDGDLAGNSLTNGFFVGDGSGLTNLTGSITNISTGLTGNGSDDALRINSTVVTNKQADVEFGEVGATLINVGDVIVHDDVLINGDLAVVGTSSNIQWTYVDIRTQVLGGTTTSYVDKTIYSTQVSYKTIITNIVETYYQTNIVSLVSTVGGNIDYGQAGSVVLPHLTDGAESNLVGSGTWVLTNATVQLAADATLGGVNIATGTPIYSTTYITDGFRVATPAIVTDGAAYLWAESNAWWTLDVTGANTLTAAVPWVISTNGLAVGEIPALAVKVALADSETNTWSWGSILTNSVTTPTAGSTNLFMLWWNGAAWVAY